MSSIPVIKRTCIDIKTEKTHKQNWDSSLAKKLHKPLPYEPWWETTVHICKYMIFSFVSRMIRVVVGFELAFSAVYLVYS